MAGCGEELGLARICGRFDWGFGGRSGCWEFVGEGAGGEGAWSLFMFCLPGLAAGKHVAVLVVVGLCVVT